MASGFCLRVLLLPLIIYGQLALGNVYRYRSENIRPHNEQAGSSSRTYSPVASSYDGFVHPRAFKAKFPEGSKASTSGEGRFFSGQVDGYSPRGSVPSYKPASLQLKPSQAQQFKPRMWETTSQSGRKGSNIVSSGAIVMQAEKSPEQQSSQTSGLTQGKTNTWDASRLQSLGSNHPGRLPASHPAFSAPAVLQTKAGMWDSLFASGAQSPGLFTPVESPQNPVAPSVPENKAGVWENPFSSSAKVPPAQNPVSQKAVWDGMFVYNAPSPGSSLPGKLPLTHPAFSTPTVVQSKVGVWDNAFGSSAKSPVVPQNQPGVWDRLSAAGAQSPGSTHPGRLPPNHPAFSAPSVVQTKEGMWDSLFASGAQSPASFPQAQFPQNPEPSVIESKSAMWKSVPTSKQQSLGPNHPGRVPLTHPAFSTPAVLNTKEGMWDSLFASSGSGPRSSRPEASGSYPLSQQPRLTSKLQQPASSTLRYNGGLGDKAALKPLRSSKTVPVSTLFQSGRPQQLEPTHGNRQPLVS